MSVYEVPNYFTLSPMFTQCPPFMTCPPYTYLDKVDQLKYQRDIVIRFTEMLEIQLKTARHVVESIDAQLGKM